MRFLEAIADALLNLSTKEMIGALLIVGVVALVVAGVYALGRGKSSPSPTFVGGLGLAAGASCMALAAGYFDYTETDWNSRSAANHRAAPRWPMGDPDRRTPPPPWNFNGAGWSSGFHVVIAADENHDGRLTQEEVAGLVREADSDGDGSVNFHDIDRLIASRFGARFQPRGPSASKPNDRANHEPPRKSRGAKSLNDDPPSENLHE